MDILNLTQEERTEILNKARQSRLNNKLERESNKHLYKTNYMDGNYWEQLARKNSIRMMNIDTPITTTNMRKAINRVGISAELFKEYLGCSLSEFIKYNPTWTAYAAIGVCLEIKEMSLESKTQK